MMKNQRYCFRATCSAAYRTIGTSYAKEWYLEAVKAFHENYMAHHDYLKNAMEKLERSTYL